MGSATNAPMGMRMVRTFAPLIHPADTKGTVPSPKSLSGGRKVTFFGVSTAAGHVVPPQPTTFVIRSAPKSRERAPSRAFAAAASGCA